MLSPEETTAANGSSVGESGLEGTRDEFDGFPRYLLHIVFQRVFHPVVGQPHQLPEFAAVVQELERLEEERDALQRELDSLQGIDS